jgi:ribonuclease P protein subunit RPR2
VTKQSRKDKPQEHREIALERIKKLFSEADLVYREDPLLSDRYVSLARKIAMKYKVSLPADVKRRICKSCNSFLVPSANSTVRLTGSKVTIHCLKCGEYTRIPYLKEQKSRRVK